MDMALECKGIPTISHTSEILAQEIQFLDTLELDNYLKQPEWSLEKIMSEIQEDHGSKYEKESYIFNAMTPDDFMRYIRQRYKGKYDFYIYAEIRAKAVDNK